MHKKKNALLVLAIIVTVEMGLIYGWSIFAIPLENEFGWQRSQTSLTFTISILSMNIGQIVGSQFYKKFCSPLLQQSVSAVLLLFGFFGASLCTRLIQFFIFYGICCGFGIGFTYVNIVSEIPSEFPGIRDMVSGMLMMGMGCGSLILGSFCSSLMQLIGWRLIFRGLAVGFAALLLLYGFFYHCIQRQKDSLPCIVDTHGEKAAQNNVSDSYTAFSTIADRSPLQMIRSKEFPAIYLWLGSLSAAGLILMGHIVPCAEQIGMSASAAALCSGIISLSNGSGRLLFGIAYDKLDFQQVLWFIAGLFLSATMLVTFAVLTQSPVLLVIGCVLTGASFGAGPISTSSIIARFYGTKYFSNNFSIVASQMIPAAFIGPYLSGALYSASGDYRATCWLLVGFGVLSILLVIWISIAAKEKMEHITP